MGTLFKIAWRNVWRHAKRTLLTVVTMAVGLGLFIASDSLLRGMDRGGLKNIVDLTDSSVRISTRAYEEERRSAPLDYGIPDPGSVEAFLRSDPRVLATTRRTRFVGELSNGRDGIPVAAVAVDPAKDGAVFALPGFVEGSWLDGAEGNAVVLGRGLAADLGLEVGSWATLSARTRYDARNADDFLVAGIINSSEPGINAAGVYVSLAAAEEFLDLEGLRTEICVRMAERANLKDAMADSDDLAAAVGRNFPGLAAKSFGEVGREFLELAKMKSKGSGLIIAVMLLIAGVGIANTVLMSVYSRVREIGVLRAFGLKPRDVSRLFLIEGAFIGVVGSAAGVVLGTALDLYFIFVGMDVEAMMGGSGQLAGGMPVWGVLYGEWNTETMAGAAVFGILVALFASRAPARKAARMEVTNALRFV